MTEDEEFEALEQRIAQQARRDACQHRWEPSFFGKAHWQPGTHQYMCKRCGKMSWAHLKGDMK